MLAAVLLRPLGQVDPDTARTLLRSELSRPRYSAARPSLWDRALTWVFDHLGDLVGRAADASPGGYLGLLGAVVLLVALAVAILVRTGPLRRTVRAAASTGALDPTTTAAGHRAAAEAATATGDWAGAVRERLRAIVAELEDTGLLVPRPGRTASQVAQEAGALNADLAPALADGTECFSQVWYGGRTATAQDAQLLAAVDRQVVATAGRRRPSDRQTPLAVPR